VKVNLKVALAMAGVCLAGRAQAQMVVVGPQAASMVLVPGAQVTVPVVADLTPSRGASLGVAAARLLWHPSVLAFRSFDAGAMGAPEVNPDSAAGLVQFLVTNAAGDTGQVVLGNAVFTVVGTPGAYDTLRLQILGLTRAVTPTNLLPIGAATASRLCVSAGLWGDLNLDAALNSFDALIILTDAVGLPITPYTTANGDVDGDGLVNTRDALIVLTYAIELPVNGFRVGAIHPGACAMEGVASVVVAPKTAAMQVSDSVLLAATAHDDSAVVIPGIALVWGTADTLVAKAGATGRVVGANPGVTQVYAYAAPGLKDSAAVTVTARPAIGFSVATVTFFDTATTADKAPKPVAITNTGGGALTGLTAGTIDYASGSGWLTATLDQATAPATLTLTTAKGVLAPGVYTATVPINSGVASNSPQTVTVTFAIAAGPAIALSSATVAFTDTLLTADPAAQTVTVTNTGNAVLSGLALGATDYGAGPTNWLTATLNQATAPATVTLGVAKGALPAGTYTATIPITSPVASNTPQAVTVTFDILPVPLVRMVLTPGFVILPLPGGTLPLVTYGFDATGEPAPTLDLRYTSRTPSVATVGPTGVVTAVAGGSAVIVDSAPGTTGMVYDSTLIAVAPSGVAVAFPVSNGRAFGSAQVGDTVHVVIAVNIGALPGEKLGSYNAQLNWDPAVLQYVHTAPAAFAAPTVNELNTSTGELRFGAADAAGAPGPLIALVDVKFVATSAGASALTFALTDLSGITPTFTQMLPAALVLSGGVQVK
jgi:hypothetical protein